MTSLQLPVYNTAVLECCKFYSSTAYFEHAGAEDSAARRSTTTCHRCPEQHACPPRAVHMHVRAQRLRVLPDRRGECVGVATDCHAVGSQRGKLSSAHFLWRRSWDSQSTLS